MITLLVVVPKYDTCVFNSCILFVCRSLVTDWHTKYEALTDMVVPRSSRLIFEDHENSLFSVTLFRKIVDDFKLRCREAKFVIC
jgi:V-type H+-transporting ATPase subunit C